MELKYVPEPYATEIINYLRQREKHITLFSSAADVRKELQRTVFESYRQIDTYPKGQVLINDDEYVAVLKDMLNLSLILDDMEITGAIPYLNKGNYYNVYSRLYKLLVSKAKLMS
jgi:hypothetical protein